jgi:Fe2+ transport system protein FeoA
MLLTQLPISRSGLLKVALESNQDIQRLEELGFVEGAKIKLLRKGPFGSPLLFEICDTQIAIRHEEAECFEVEPLDKAC